MDAAKRVAYALTLAAFALTWIAPAWPAEQALHSSLTVVALAALWWIDRRSDLALGRLSGCRSGFSPTSGQKSAEQE